MRVKQDLGDALAEALDAVAEFGSPDRHTLAQVLGRETYDSLMSKQRTAETIEAYRLASVLSVLKSCLEASEVERRLEELEAAIAAREQFRPRLVQ